MRTKEFALLISSLVLLQNNPALAQSFGQLKGAAVEAQSAKKYDTAQECWKKLADTCEDKTGPRYMQALSGLASCYAEQEKNAEADETYKKFLALCKTDGLSDDSKAALTNYTKFLRKQQRESEAAELETKFSLLAVAPKEEPKQTGPSPKEIAAAKAKEEAAKKEADEKLLQSLNEKAQTLISQNKSAAAEPLLKQALELTRNFHGAVTREYAKALNDHADVLRKLNRRPEAIAEETKAERILSQLDKTKPGEAGAGAASASNSGNAAGTRSGSLYSRANAAQGINRNSQVPGD